MLHSRISAIRASKTMLWVICEGKEIIIINVNDVATRESRVKKIEFDFPRKIFFHGVFERIFRVIELNSTKSLNWFIYWFQLLFRHSVSAQLNVTNTPPDEMSMNFLKSEESPPLPSSLLSLPDSERELDIFQHEKQQIATATFKDTSMFRRIIKICDCVREIMWKQKLISITFIIVKKRKVSGLQCPSASHCGAMSCARFSIWRFSQPQAQCVMRIIRE